MHPGIIGISSGGPLSNYVESIAGAGNYPDSSKMERSFTCSLACDGQSGDGIDR